MEDIEHGVYVPLVGQIGFSATEIRAGNCLFSNINPRGIVIRDGKVEIDFEQLNFDVNANYQIHYGKFGKGIEEGGETARRRSFPPLFLRFGII